MMSNLGEQTKREIIFKINYKILDSLPWRGSPSWWTAPISSGWSVSIAPVAITKKHSTIEYKILITETCDPQRIPQKKTMNNIPKEYSKRKIYEELLNTGLGLCQLQVCYCNGHWICMSVGVEVNVQRKVCDSDGHVNIVHWNLYLSLLSSTNLRDCEICFLALH